jgi:hypothetical protein
MDTMLLIALNLLKFAIVNQLKHACLIQVVIVHVLRNAKLDMKDLLVGSAHLDTIESMENVKFALDQSQKLLLPLRLQL